MSWLIMFLIINLCVISHEYGHYRVARACGLPVSVFSVGIGPGVTFWHTRSGMQVKLGLIPLGGYVRIESIEAAPWPHQLLTLLAGPLVNLLFALLVMCSLRVAYTPGEPALPLVIKEAAQLVTLPFWAFIGFFTASFWHALAMQGNFSGSHDMVGQLIARHGFWQGWLQYFGLINLVLYGFNMVPIPPLDGGRIALLGLRRWLAPRQREMVGGALVLMGALFLLGTMLYTTVIDGLRVFGHHP